MANVSADLDLLQTVAQFFSYAVLALFAENVVFSRALGISRLMKVLDDPRTRTWQYCTPIILVQLISAPLGWLAHNLLFPLLRQTLPAWLPYQAFRPLIYLTCAIAAMAVVWVLAGVAPKNWRRAFREQMPLAVCNTGILGTLLLCANRNYTLLQSVAFGLGSGLGYVFAVFVVDEGRRRLRSKDVPGIFKGLPSSLIYIGILSMALYGLVGSGTAI